VSEEFNSEIEIPFTMMPTAIWEIGLSGNEMIILQRILFRAGLRGQCFESRKSIAEACCLSDRTVGIIFDELERLNIIQIIRRQLEGKPNLIRVKQPASWISKRKNLPKSEGGSDNSSYRGRKPFPTGWEKISHRTRSHEQDSIELDSSSLAAAEATAPEIIEAEIVLDELPKKQSEPKHAERTALTKQKAPVGKDQASPISKAWGAYSEAFKAKYGVEPIRNAKVMGQLKQFIERVGQNDAPDILRFYLQQHDRWTVQNGHTVGIALHQAEKLAAGFRGAKMMTEKEARRIDEKQTTQNILEAYEARKDDYFEV